MKGHEKNKVSVHIYGEPYRLVGEASAEHIQQVAQLVDQKMKEISAKSPSLDSVKIAVLSAVNIADELFQLKREYQEILQLLEEQTKE